MAMIPNVGIEEKEADIPSVLNMYYQDKGVYPFYDVIEDKSKDDLLLTVNIMMLEGWMPVSTISTKLTFRGLKYTITMLRNVKRNVVQNKKQQLVEESNDSIKDVLKKMSE